MYMWVRIQCTNFQWSRLKIQAGLTMLSDFEQTIKGLPKANKRVKRRWCRFLFHFRYDGFHEALAPEVYLFLDRTIYTLFFQRQLPFVSQLHRRTM